MPSIKRRRREKPYNFKMIKIGKLFKNKSQSALSSIEPNSKRYARNTKA
jgi:hypothetical protein